MTNFKPAVALIEDHVLLPCRPMLVLNDRELEFMRLVCTECTYKEIADRMCLSPRTIDGYRDSLFEKLNVRTRVGLAMFAVRNGIVDIVPIQADDLSDGSPETLESTNPSAVGLADHE